MSETALSKVRIVLVEPAGALNVGSIARILKNMGLHRLVLVNPGCDPLCAEARQMAVHAGDVLAAAEIVQTLPAALVGCQRAIATAVRTRSTQTPLEHPRNALPWLLQGEDGVESALIFGPEDRGLSNEELKYAQRLVCIPSSPVYTSLNLAQAVAICSYELYQYELYQIEAMGQQGTEADSESEPMPQRVVGSSAPLEAIESYFRQLEELLLTVGFIYPHTAQSRMEKLRRLLNRAYPSVAEVTMLRGILRQIDWALKLKR
ncbi:MAG: RNA methyltransferase [Leptolyngbyaceae cyanobacterium CSU_1_3]|nr:RNA methyltransferase [Leptolyngbyaceae cyanobacterium CSU_1_3]